MGHFLEVYLQIALFMTVASPLLLLLLHIYLAPWSVARFRGHPNRSPILVINLLLGWTVVAWVLSLAWAVCDLSKASVSKLDALPIKKQLVYLIAFIVVISIPIAIWKAWSNN